MSILVWLAVVPLLAPVGSCAQQQEQGLWQRIRSFEETPEGNPELIRFLQSLSAQEMLTAARQGCAAARGDERLSSDLERAERAASSVVLCVEFYFERVEAEPGYAGLLAVIEARDEDPWLRRALLLRLSGGHGGSRFAARFQELADRRLAALDATLTRIGDDRGEDALVRLAALDALHGTLARVVKPLVNADANVRALAERSTRVVRVAELLRSGELTLTPETRAALAPIESRVLAHAEALARIAGDRENETADVRRQARALLERCGRLPLTNSATVDGLLEQLKRQDEH